MTSRIKTADEIIGTSEYDVRADRIEALESLCETWIRAFHKGGPRDIVYVATLQQKIRNLKKRLC